MKIQEQCKEYILNHMEESKKSALMTTMTIQKSELNAGNGNYTRTLQIPKFFSQDDKQLFTDIVNTTYKIFCKVIDAYKKDINIRKLFPFSKELEELILLEPDYNSIIPICRIDIFFDEETKDFYFCEFNTDGTSAMNENARLNEFLTYNNVIQNLDTPYEIMEVLNKWAHTFIDICKTNPRFNENFHIAIVDFLEHSYLSELKVYEKLFNDLGYSCELVDIRKLEYRDSHLYSTQTQKRIDVIYRRAVTKDIMEMKDTVQPFIQAVKDNNVCIVGAFQTQVDHHKEISKVLVNPVMKAYFSKEENEFIEKHLPKTYDLTKDILDEVIQNKDQWIIKPKDGFASLGVYTGIDQNHKNWEDVVLKCVNKDYIVQQYITPYKMDNIDLVNYDHFMKYSNLTGLYCFNGEFAGVYSRLSDSGIISTQYNEKTIPTLFIK